LLLGQTVSALLQEDHLTQAVFFASANNGVLSSLCTSSDAQPRWLLRKYVGRYSPDISSFDSVSWPGDVATEYLFHSVGDSSVGDMNYIRYIRKAAGFVYPAAIRDARSPPAD
jgi:hypothetical protein